MFNNSSNPNYLITGLRKAIFFGKNMAAWEDFQLPLTCTCKWVLKIKNFSMSRVPVLLKGAIAEQSFIWYAIILKSFFLFWAFILGHSFGVNISRIAWFIHLCSHPRMHQLFKSKMYHPVLVGERSLFLESNTSERRV